jgi:hypothetical protein
MKNNEIIRQQVRGILETGVGNLIEADKSIDKSLSVGENRDYFLVPDIKKDFGLEYKFDCIEVFYTVSVGKEFISEDPAETQTQPCYSIATVDKILVDGVDLDYPKLISELSSELWNVCESGGVFNI